MSEREVEFFFSIATEMKLFKALLSNILNASLFNCRFIIATERKADRPRINGGLNTIRASARVVSAVDILPRPRNEIKWAYGITNLESRHLITKFRVEFLRTFKEFVPLLPKLNIRNEHNIMEIERQCRLCSRFSRH